MAKGKQGTPLGSGYRRAFNSLTEAMDNDPGKNSMKPYCLTLHKGDKASTFFVWGTTQDNAISTLVQLKMKIECEAVTQSDQVEYLRRKLAEVQAAKANGSADESTEEKSEEKAEEKPKEDAAAQ